MVRRGGRVWRGGLLALCALLSACASESSQPGQAAPGTSPSPTRSIRTYSPIPQPDLGPPAGRLVADLRQSSRDAALGRFQVWIGNGLARPVDPSAIDYRDPRFRTGIPAERLRAIPADSERGYPLAQPARPVCGSRGAGRVTVTYAGRTTRIPVEDEADVVARYVESRCFQLALGEAATLAFDAQVEVDRPGRDGVATITLLATPSGRPGHRILVETVSGTPVLTPDGQPVWTPRLLVRSEDAPVRIELPVVPARCDPHAFMESGGATAFRVKLRLDGKPGELLVRMPAAGASRVLDYARDACGLGQ
ncbi:hypothetical protein [Nocardioides houyundeii]|uniref:hypothetical protein n=1 Tax=Nocardioides houyundeii TaxID=2045452 RepID=UPI000DF3B4F4|nr:hypothetical protein [Nocardioides houyundeii]